jgi:hypothetical protein
MLVQAMSGWTGGGAAAGGREAGACRVRTRLLGKRVTARPAGARRRGKLTPPTGRRHPRYGAWLIIRCAYGVPAHMIHVPSFFGVVEKPVAFAS